MRIWFQYQRNSALRQGWLSRIPPVATRRFARADRCQISTSRVQKKTALAFLKVSKRGRAGKNNTPS